MRNLPLIACLSLTLLSACGTPESGYYDANGNWIPYNRYNEEAHEHPPLPGGPRPPYDNREVTVYKYDRPGYYDYNGYYITSSSDMVPLEMLPPRGACRVWYPGRPPAEQPPIESCHNITHRVPPGTYILYGG